eukprot:scaffold20.g7686.t1
MMAANAVTGVPFRAGSVHTVGSVRQAVRRAAVVRATSDPLLHKPVLKPQPPAPPAAQVAAPAPEAPAHEAAAPAAAAAAAAAPGVTIEFQRQQAKVMSQYFTNLKLEKTVEQSRIFGWTKKNEIGNGRWVMTGIAVGLLTEYATGVDVFNQIKLMLRQVGREEVPPEQGGS